MTDSKNGNSGENGISRRQFLKLLGSAGVGAVGAFTAAEYMLWSKLSGEQQISGVTGMQTASGNTYYIAPDGDDGNDGSEEAPLFSLTEADSQASSGDTIIVMDGTYEYGSEVQRIDTAGVTVQAADGANPVMVWSSGAQGWQTPTTEGILIDGADEVVVDGLELRDSAAWGLHITNANNVAVRNVEAHNNAGPGIGVAYQGSDLLFQNCLVHHNGVEGQTTGDGDGIIVNGSSGDVSGTVIEHCELWENTDDGVDCWDGSGVTVRNSKAWDNGRTGSADDGSGMGFKLGGGNQSGNNHIERCLAWDNEYAGISDNQATQGITIWNCTAWNNPRNYALTNDSNETINCISHDGPEHMSGNEQTNTWNEGINDPQFQSTDPESSEFLQLQDGSPCIDAGTEVDLEYNGDAPDLGAYEQGMDIIIGVSDGVSSDDSRETDTDSRQASGGSKSTSSLC